MESFILLQRKVLKAQAYTWLSGRQALKLTVFICQKTRPHCFFPLHFFWKQ